MTPASARNDLAAMRDSVFFDGPEAGRKYSRFWMLLTLAAIIAAAGVVGDSTATVIGAMIVAPLMTPVLGTMLAVVLGDKRNLVRCLALVILGALAAVAIGYLLGLVVVNPVTAATNSQVAQRVNPRLIDLVAALATGAVGSIALIRRDISDTLPGVAIAISLVPPLSVVGLTLEAGAYRQAGGALLLFVTNVAAILAAGTAVMGIYGVHRMKPQLVSHEERAINRRNAVTAIAVALVVIAVPLAANSYTVARDTSREAKVKDAATTWGHQVGWEVVDVSTEAGKVVVEMRGPLPLPATSGLRADVVSKGVDPRAVQVDLVPQELVNLGTSTALLSGHSGRNTRERPT